MLDLTREYKFVKVKFTASAVICIQALNANIFAAVTSFILIKAEARHIDLWVLVICVTGVMRNEKQRNGIKIFITGGDNTSFNLM